MSDLSRREWLAAVPVCVGVGASAVAHASAPPAAAEAPFGFCLNTSTISGQKLTIVQEAEIAAKVGYQGIEPWIRELDEHVKTGHSLEDLGKRFRDLGLTVASTIGFFEWAVDDDARRKKALEEARRNLEMVRKVGGLRLAAPPVGVTDRSDVDLRRLAERYRALLKIGDEFGVVPEVEVWGFSQTLGRLADAVFVAIEAGHPKACVLGDVYHFYKGGTSFEGLRLLGPETMHVIHMNDYPADPPRATIVDAQRVYPGDGVAPLKEIFQTLRAVGFHGMLSLELFNRAYWKHDALTVAQTGLEKMREAVRSSFV